MHSFENGKDAYVRHESDRGTPTAERRHTCSAKVAQLYRRGGSNSLAASYVAVAMFGLGAHLINAAYWTLSSLTASFNAELGSFSLAALYIAYIGSLLVAPSLVAILGSKTCSVLSGVCTLLFTASYFIPSSVFSPSWYTIIPASLAIGLSYGFLYTALGVTKNDEVRRVVDKWKVDELTYQGRFSAIIIVACNSAAVVAGLVSVTFSGFNIHHTSSSSPTSVALSNSTAAATVNSTNYTILVAVCTAIAFLSVVIFSITRGAAYHQCRIRSFGLREALHTFAKHGKNFFKQVTTSAYALAVPLQLLHGSVEAYFFGVFTKMYITEGVGVEYVGVSVILWGFFCCLGSFSGGWLLRFMANYVLVAITIGLGQIGAIVFIIMWVHQPSFVVVTILSAIFGMCYGLTSTTALVYSGIAPGYSQEIGYSLFVIASCFGNSIQFVLSKNVTPEVNLYVLLTLSALAVPLFSTADLHFGSGRSRHCCRRKQSVETSNQFEQDCKPKGFLEHTSHSSPKETSI